MNNPPRKHHFVPQFWIKKFAAGDGQIWAFDKDDGLIKPRSSKKLMQLFNLYTVQPSGLDDTTLETVELNWIDTDGAAVLDRVITGDRTQAAKEGLAAFFAAQVIRDPTIITSYNPKAQEITLSLLEVFDAPDYQTFLKLWSAHFPGDQVVQEFEYDYIKSFGLHGAESAFDKIITDLDSTDGLPELPFTDLVRSPDGRKIVCDHLLKFEWCLKISSASPFVLGDTGVLFEKGEMGHLRAPLSSSVALFLAPCSSPGLGIKTDIATQQEVEDLNWETAARSRRWLVGDKALLEILKTQVGTAPLIVT